MSRYRAQSAPGPLSLMNAAHPPQLRPFGSNGSSDEDPYSVAGSGSSGSSGNNNRGGSKGSTPPSSDRPPKLPPRDNSHATSIYGASIWARPLGTQLSRGNGNGSGGGGNGSSSGGGHLSRKDGNNNNPKKSRKSTGGKKYNNTVFIGVKN